MRGTFYRVGRWSLNQPLKTLQEAWLTPRPPKSSVHPNNTPSGWMREHQNQTNCQSSRESIPKKLNSLQQQASTRPTLASLFIHTHNQCFGNKPTFEFKYYHENTFNIWRRSSCVEAVDVLSWVVGRNRSQSSCPALVNRKTPSSQAL